ncbi:MAG: hypothetical protein JWR07_5683, partial [Nevskia sp.]|nr:hypothetical protein [Nevskia sp.]
PHRALAIDTVLRISGPAPDQGRMVPLYIELIGKRPPAGAA